LKNGGRRRKKITKRVFLALTVIFLLNSGSSSVFAIPIFFGPITPCLSAADIPAGFYAGGSPALLEDFEDFPLDGGITASAGFGTESAGNVDAFDAHSVNGVEIIPEPGGIILLGIGLALLAGAAIK